MLIHLILHIAVLTGVILLLARLLPSVRVKSVGTAIVVAIVFSVLNVLLGWFIRAMLFVPALFTLGLLFFFIPFIVNSVLLWLTDKLIGSFTINTFGSLLVSAAAITLVNGLLHFVPHSQRLYHHAGPIRWI